MCNTRGGSLWPAVSRANERRRKENEQSRRAISPINRRQGMGLPRSGKVSPPKPKGTENSRRTCSTVPSATASKMVGEPRSIDRSFSPT